MLYANFKRQRAFGAVIIFIFAVIFSGNTVSAKGFFDSAKEFVGEVLDNEVYVCDLETDTPGENVSIYFAPTTKKYQKWGLIFIDEGYKLNVIYKYPDGKKFSMIYFF